MDYGFAPGDTEEDERLRLMFSSYEAVVKTLQDPLHKSIVVPARVKAVHIKGCNIGKRIRRTKGTLPSRSNVFGVFSDLVLSAPEAGQG